MPYLSDIQHRRVLDAGGDHLGHLRDLAVMPGERIPAVQWAILATGDGERVLRWSDLAIEPAHVRLRRRLEGLPPEALPAGVLRLGRDLLDQDIVDAATATTGKVTDLQLEESAGQLRLLGADVGYRGLLRRIGIEGPVDGIARLVGRPLPRRIVAWGDVRLPERAEMGTA
ncbi:MAG: hypothetical protein HYU87_02150 [Chloroflexi bacterium]|nr:hypothetical protein [Chloroflexota bacterium]